MFLAYCSFDFILWSLVESKALYVKLESIKLSGLVCEFFAGKFKSSVSWILIYIHLQQHEWSQWKWFFRDINPDSYFKDVQRQALHTESITNGRENRANQCKVETTNGFNLFHHFAGEPVTPRRVWLQAHQAKRAWILRHRCISIILRRGGSS